MARLRRRRRRIGITGIGNSGKSVFLTSLLSHLENHDPQAMPLGRDGLAVVRGFEVLEAQAGGECFDYEGHRRTLVDLGRWPAKTTDMASLRFSLRRSDWPLTDLEIELLDFPGERVADGVMLGRDYGAWCDAVLGPLRYDATNAALAADFLAALEQRSDEAELVATYRLALARLALAYQPLISPSTFLLGTDGQMARVATAEAIASERRSGLENGEFVPLPSVWRARSPELAHRFAERYQAYRDRVVQPIFSFLRGCHRLLILVDIPGILMGGTGRYNDQRQIIKHLFAVLDPHRGLLARLAGLAARTLLAERFKPGGISRIALVASKCDLVHPVDRARVQGLLRDMTSRLAEDRGSWRTGYFPCSALVSTTALPGDQRSLAGRLVFDQAGNTLPPDAPERRFQVSELPAEWPSHWSAGSYIFPEVYPAMARRMDLPPKQIGLGEVFDFLTAEDLME